MSRASTAAAPASPPRGRQRAFAHAAPRRAAVLTVAAAMSLSAIGGGLGLIVGFLTLPDELASRLPFRSPVFGGVALLVVVAVPTGCAAVLAARRHPRYADVSALAGLALVGWIAVEVAIVRMFSPLQVVCGLAGVVLVVLGSAAWNHGRPTGHFAQSVDTDHPI